MDEQDRATFNERIFDLWMQGFSLINQQFDAFAISQIKSMQRHDIYVLDIYTDDDGCSWLSIIFSKPGLLRKTTLSLELLLDHQEAMIIQQGRCDGLIYAAPRQKRTPCTEWYDIT